MRKVVENPPPLNAIRAFPYKVSPFPTDWLLRFTSLGTIPETRQPAQSISPKSDPNSTTSLESWT